MREYNEDANRRSSQDEVVVEWDYVRFFGSSMQKYLEQDEVRHIPHIFLTLCGYDRGIG